MKIASEKMNPIPHFKYYIYLKFYETYEIFLGFMLSIVYQIALRAIFLNYQRKCEKN